MSERAELIEQIVVLEIERTALIATEQSLHDRFMSAVPGSDDERMIGHELDRLCTRLDAIGDTLGPLKSRLYEIEADVSRREFLADAAYGRNP